MTFYVSKSLVAATSTGIAVLSTASPAAVTISSLQATNIGGTTNQRRLILWTTGGSTDFSASFTIIGTRQGGGVVSETIAGSTGSPATVTTLQDFLTVTSVSVSSVLQAPVTIGTATVGGTPWQVSNNDPTPYNIGFGLTYSTTRTAMLGYLEYTFDDFSGNAVNPNSTVGLPYPWTSTALSTTANTAGNGFINFPIAGWRLSITSTSTQTPYPSAYISAVPSGMGN